MEYYQAIQTRAGQTVAVINHNVPALTVGGVTSAGLLTQSQALNALAQARDNALTNTTPRTTRRTSATWPSNRSSFRCRGRLKAI